MTKITEVRWQSFSADKEHRTSIKAHQSKCVWLRGYSGVGKSTIANALERQHFESSIHTYLLDEDNVRQGLNRAPGFSDADRSENIRRVAEVYVDTLLDVCESRDPKGLYAKARRGQLPAFTGIDSPYEPPINPELRIDNNVMDVEACVNALVNQLNLSGLSS